MRNLIAFILMSSVFVLGCEWENYYQRELPGKWNGVSWTTESGEPYVDPDRVSFTFKADSSYSAVLGARTEQGVWWVDGFKLYTIAEDAQRNLVKVIELEDDTVKFEMNRGGQKEILVLARK